MAHRSAVQILCCFLTASVTDPHGLTQETAVNPKPAFQPKSAEVKFELAWIPGPHPLPFLKFKCQFDTKPGDKDLQYMVYWYIDGVLLPLLPAVTEDNLDDATIKEDVLGRLGVTLKCGVRVRNGDFGTANDMVSSVDFFAGIKILTPTLTLKRGQVQQIRVEPTVPFGCSLSQVLGHSCRGQEGVSLSMYDPDASHECDDDSRIVVTNSLTCGAFLDGISYEDYKANKTEEWKKTYTFDVTTAKDTMVEMKKRLFSVYLVTDNSVEHKIWRSYSLPAITINVVDDNPNWKGKICYMHSDPHMRTADGTYYNIQHSGEYIMYKHKEYPMEVQYKTKPFCNSSAQCGCAVTVRAGRDIFTINQCEAKKQIDFLSCKDHILDVVAETETKYKVTLPLGTVVRIKSVLCENTLNVDITMSVKDYDATEGLCGSFNGDPNDDFTIRGGGVKDRDTFISSWLVQPANSYLLEANHNPPEWPKTSLLYVCHGNQTVCAGSESVACETDSSVKNFECRQRKDSSTKRRKKWVHGLTEDEMQTNIDIQTDDPISSFDDAKDACQEVFEKHPCYSLKDQLTENELLVESIRECALGVNMTGNIICAATHLDSWVDNSMELISKNNIFLAVSAAVASAFAENACHYLCSGHGICRNGTCVCENHFAAADCSIDSRTPPRTEGLYNDGLCNWQEEDCCDGFSVYGQPFVQTTSCTVKQSTVFTDGSQSTVGVVVVPAQFRSIYEVVCPVNCTQGTTPKGPNGELPFTSTYDISISNDAQNFGQELTMMVYDSECQDLINDTTPISFALKNGSCFIDQTCVRDGAQKPSDHCFVCDAVNQPYNWTRNQDCM